MDVAVAWFFVATGAAFFVLTTWDTAMAIASRRWPSVTGTIESASVQEERGPEGGMLYGAAIKYRYDVVGKTFTADRTHFGNRLKTGWSSPARKIVRRYPPGATVTVYYAPDDPADAVLEPGLNASLFVGLVIDVAVVTLGMSLLAAQ